MYPILWQYGSFVIPTWHVSFLIASVTGFFYFRFLTKIFYPQLLVQVHSAFLYAYLGALIGARLLSVLIEEIKVSDYFAFDSLTFYGGFLGALFSVSIWVYVKKIPWAPFWDLMIAPMFLGLAIGRVGCFLNGDDFGIAVAKDLHGNFPWWAVSFPNHPEPIPRFPVQLMESLGGLFLAFLLPIFFRKITNFRMGLVGSIGVLSYCILRFFIENYRDDYRGWFVENRLSSSQGISLILASGIVLYYIFKKRKGVLL